MFRVISANLNGVRSAANKGFFEWLQQQNADVLGVQELKAQREHIDGAFDRCDGLVGHFHCAVKKGYSGVGVYARQVPSEVVIGIEEPEFDDEGRWVELRFDRPGRKLSLISAYFPSGSSSPERQQAKFRFLAHLYPRLQALAKEREFILVGDVNIAHREADLKNWRGNVKNSGFLPEERAWMDQLLGEAGLVDVYRLLQPDATDDCYTWWSNRGRARENNVGWRIDYHLATPGLAATAKTASVYKDTWFSDHAPLTIDYDFSL